MCLQCNKMDYIIHYIIHFITECGKRKQIWLQLQNKKKISCKGISTIGQLQKLLSYYDC